MPVLSGSAHAARSTGAVGMPAQVVPSNRREFAEQGGFDNLMTDTHGTGEFDKTLHDVNDALALLTDTLSEVRGCEYPRLLAREIQALIVACVAHERVKQATAGAPHVDKPTEALEGPPAVADTSGLLAMLEAREAEISNLRDLLHHGVETIEAHTLMDPDGTVVMSHGDYQCISATAIEQWLDRAAAALDPARPATG
jgi:hypothetical protein